MHLKLPPPIIFVISLVLMLLFSKFLPWSVIRIPGASYLSTALTAWALGMVAWCVGSFRRVGTTIHPQNPEHSTQLVAGGLYRFSRNPMYTSLVLLILAAGIHRGQWFGLLVIPVFFVLYMNKFQIRPEEEALGQLFGDEYSNYCARVRRWI